MIHAVADTATTQVDLHIDHEAFEYHLTIGPAATPACIRSALAAATHQGLEPIPPDEDEPESLDDGSIRVWLVPTKENNAP